MKLQDEASFDFGNKPDFVYVSELKVICCVFVECGLQIKQRLCTQRNTF